MEKHNLNPWGVSEETATVVDIDNTVQVLAADLEDK
jgi:cyanophycinase-like exopeptidase